MVKVYLLNSTWSRWGNQFSLESTDTIVVEHHKANITTWHSDFSFVRPKWGIYRSLKDKHKIKNQEDRVYMNNFTVRKWKTNEVKTKRLPHLSLFCRNILKRLFSFAPFLHRSSLLWPESPLPTTELKSVLNQKYLF